MAKKLDTYQTWEKTGVLKSKLDYIKAASATFYTQKEMCRDLGITEQTFTQLKINILKFNKLFPKARHCF